MRFTYMLLFSLLGYSSFSQAELVADINEGQGDSGIYCYSNFTFNQECVVELDGKLLFYAENEDVGREIYVLQDGNVELLVDLNEDPTTSNPQFMTVFDGLVYFIADDNTGYKIWQTDGSASGTQVAFDIFADGANSLSITGFLKNDNELYFAYEGAIYVFDGQDLTSVTYTYDIMISAVSPRNSYAWCSYKEGIAVMAYNGTSWDMLYIHDNTVDRLFTANINNSNKNPYALAAFEGGISFSFDAPFSDNTEGRYLYLESEGAFFKQSDDFTLRTFSVDDESALLLRNGEFIFYNGDNPMGTEILNSQLDLVQGQDWNRLSLDRFMIFESSGGVFLDAIVSSLNTEDGTLETIYTGDDLSKMYIYENNLVFFAESENSTLDMGLFVYSYNTGELEQVYEFVDLPFNADLYPIGVQGDHLYFHGYLDGSIGTEIYKIAIDFPTSTVDVQSDKRINFIQKGTNTFLVETDLEHDFRVDVYSTNGQLIKSVEVSQNTIIDVPYSGIVIMKANIGNALESHLKVVSR